MKVLFVNGSPNEKGCTYTGLHMIQEELEKQGIQTQLYQVGRKPIVGCIGCRTCSKPGHEGKCVFTEDLVNTVAEDLKTADGLIIGSPVHYAAASGAATSFFDRLFYCTEKNTKRLKFGAAIVSCRRGGSTAAFEQLNKYFTISEMPVVSSCYWNGIHGNTPEEVLQDEEGIRVLKTLANNMAYLLKCKEGSNIPLPEELPPARTNFIR